MKILRLVMDQYNCEVPNGEILAAEQALKDDSIPYEDGEDEIEMINPNSPIHSAPITFTLNQEENHDQLTCPVKSCGKSFQKSETSEGKNLFTHMKANHQNAYLIFRRLERLSTTKQCKECLFWFTNGRDYAAHNQQTGNKRDDSFKGSYCEQYQKMAMTHMDVRNIYELPEEEQLDFDILENSFKCKIPFELIKNELDIKMEPDPLNGLAITDFKNQELTGKVRYLYS